MVAALEAEARTLGWSMSRGRAPSALADGTLIAVSGMGSAGAAAAARALIDAGATALVSWGLAGGLDPQLPSGTICLPKTVMSVTGGVIDMHHHWREAVGAAIAARHRVVDGKLLTTSHALVDSLAKAAAYRDTGAVAVDMESFAIAAVAAERQLPFIAVRVVVDAAGDSLPVAVVAASQAGQVSVMRLMRGLLNSPLEVTPVIQLAQRYRLAIQALTAIARTGALAPLAFAMIAGNRMT